MRHLPIAVATAVAFWFAACDGGDGSGGGAGASGGEPSTGDAGASTAHAGAGTADAGEGPGPAAGGNVSSGQVEFADLPGKIRFINFVSDGSAGVNLDLYWGTSIGQGELVATLPYGEITEYLTPRRAVKSIRAADEAVFFVVPEGDVTGTAGSFLVQDDQVFTADTVLTIAMAAADSPPLNVSEQVFDEAALTTPPAGMAHVYGWSSAFDQIADGDFVLVGAEGLCSPDNGEPGGANLGVPSLIPDGTTGLSLFDANTEPPCDTGATPVTDSVEAGHSYVLLGEAETYEIDARKTVFLELNTAN